MSIDHGISLLWVVTRHGSHGAHWSPERFFFLAFATDGADGAIMDLHEGHRGLRLEVQQGGNGMIRHCGMERPSTIFDAIVIDARPAFIHKSGISFAEAVSDDVAFAAHPMLDACLGNTTARIVDSEVVIEFLNRRAAGDAE